MAAAKLAKKKQTSERKKGAQVISLEKNFDLALSEAKKAILAGKLVVYPTDTLYGIGCNALDKKAVAKIYSAKVREKGKPLSMIVADLKMMRDYCEISEKELTALLAMLPGPYTFLLKAKKRLPVSNDEKLGVRVPEHVFMRTVSKQLGLPIVTTSANMGGGKPPVSLRDVPLSVRKAAAVVIDNGKCKYGQGSTVIDLVERKVLRKGAIGENSRGPAPGICA